MTRYISLICCICIAFNLSAKNYTSVVVDKAGKQPVAYANVGIVGHNIGTVSGEDGTFILDVPDSLNTNAMVMVSMIGYEPYRTSLRELASRKEIPLNRSDNTLKEVVVKSKVFNRRVLGNTTKSMSVTVGFRKDSTLEEQQLGYELGTLMKIKRKPTLIDSVFINFAQCSNDSLFFRLNIYEEVKDSFINILPKPYYVAFSRAEALKGIKMNLRDLELTVSNNFLVSLELIREMEPGSLFFSASFLSSKTYFRAASQGDWHKLPMNIGIGISAKVRD